MIQDETFAKRRVERPGGHKAATADSSSAQILREVSRSTQRLRICKQGTCCNPDGGGPVRGPAVVPLASIAKAAAMSRANSEQ